MILIWFQWGWQKNMTMMKTPVLKIIEDFDEEFSVQINKQPCTSMFMKSVIIKNHLCSIQQIRFCEESLQKRQKGFHFLYIYMFPIHSQSIYKLRCEQKKIATQKSSTFTGSNQNIRTFSFKVPETISLWEKLAVPKLSFVLWYNFKEAQKRYKHLLLQIYR